MVTPSPSSQEQQSLPIPAVGWEESVWIPVNREMYSRAEIRRQSGTYESAIPASLADWTPAIDAELGADIEDATRALIDFDRYTAAQLGIDAATLGPMSAILLRTESASSSQIEQLTVGARQLALAEIDAGDSPNSREVIGNVRAMEAALNLSEAPSLDSLLTMHRELLRHQYGMESHAGKLRDEPVWIGRGSAGPRTADFVAPQPPLLRPALADLLRFTERPDIPLLILIAVSHAQFETIHPFVDGNGRTGRALVQALLRSTGITSHTTVPLSAGLLTDTQQYFSALTDFRAGDAEPICRVFAQAGRYAALSGRALVDALSKQLEDSREQLAGIRRHAVAWQLLPHLVAHPVVNAAFVQRHLGVTAPAAHRALATLAEREVIVERSGKRRGRIWQHPGILKALDDYAAGIRRDSTGR